MAYQLVLFDIDGTLVDSFAAYRQTMQAILPAFHQSPTVAALCETFSMSIDDEMAALKIPVNQKSRLLAAYDRETKRANHHEPLFPGIIDMLDQLQRHRIHVGVVTSRLDADIANLDPNVFLNRMAIVVTADQVPYPKPDPRPLQFAINQLGVQPQESLYVGDAGNDEVAAKAANVDFGAALWGNSEAPFLRPNYHFYHPKDLIDVALSK